MSKPVGLEKGYVNYDVYLKPLVECSLLKNFRETHKACAPPKFRVQK